MIPGIGVFGTGDVVHTVVPFLRSKGFRVEAVWGTTLDAAEKVATELNIKFYTNKVDDVLLRKDVDLVFILCPPNLHAQIAVKALGIGKHVLCDRPAGLCQLEVLKMVHAAQYYPTLISIISHSLRFLPAFTQMKNYLSKEYIGNVQLCDVNVQCRSLICKKFDWTCSHLMGGGILTTIGSHIIDIVSFVLGEKAIRVHGFMRTFQKNTDTIKGIRWIDSDDFCTFQMVLRNDVCVNVTLNSLVPGNFKQEVIVCGSKGYLSVRGSNLYGFRNSTGKEEMLFEDSKEPLPSLTNFKNQSSNGNDVSSNLPDAYMQGLLRMISALKDAFASGDTERGWLKEPVSTAATFEDGQYVQAVIDSIRLSYSTRQWEQVIVSHEEIQLSSLITRLNVPNIDQSALQALSRSSTARIPVSKKSVSETHSIWGFATNKH